MFSNLGSLFPSLQLKSSFSVLSRPSPSPLSAHHFSSFAFSPFYCPCPYLQPVTYVGVLCCYKPRFKLNTSYSELRQLSERELYSADWCCRSLTTHWIILIMYLFLVLEVIKFPFQESKKQHSKSNSQILWLTWGHVVTLWHWWILSVSLL